MLNGKRIFIEDGDGIGDLIMVTPTLRKIKELYPEAILTFATFGKCLEIVSRLPYIDYSYFLDNSIIGRIKSIKYMLNQDYVFFRSYQPTLIRFAYYLNIPHRAGVCKEKYKDSSLWTVKFPMEEKRKYNEMMSEYVSRQISEGLKINLKIDKQCDVSLPTVSEEQKSFNKLKATGKILNKKYAIIAPFTARGVDLNYEIVSAAVKRINSKGYDCIILNVKKHPMLTQIAEETHSGVYDMSGQTNLMDIISLSRNANFGFTVDTGIMHVLCALKIPTVSIFTSGFVNWWAPPTYCYPIAVDLSCKPCHNQKNCENKRCVNEIKISEVLEKIDMLINKLENGETFGA